MKQIPAVLFFLLIAFQVTSQTKPPVLTGAGKLRMYQQHEAWRED